MHFLLFPMVEVQGATKAGVNIWADTELIIEFFVERTEYYEKGKGRLPQGTVEMCICKGRECRVSPL